MNGTRHSRTYPWRQPFRWLWLVLALAASGVMVVKMPAGMDASASGRPRMSMKPAGETPAETRGEAKGKEEAPAASPAPAPRKRHHSRSAQAPETGAEKILARLPQIGSLIGLVALAAFIGGIAEIFRFHFALGKLFGGLARWAHLPEIISLSIPTALYSNAAANGMLVSSHAEGKITHSNLIAGGMMNSYLSFGSHSLRVAYPVIGAVGLPAICYFGWQMGFGFLFIAGVLFLHRRKSPAAVPQAAASGEAPAAGRPSPEWRKSLRQTCLRVLALVFRMLCLTVPLMIGVEWLMKNGLFSWWEEHVPDWVNRIFPAELMSIVAAQMGGLVQAAGVAANLRSHGMVTSSQILLAMLVASAIGNPIRALRRNLPSAMGIFPARDALTIVLVMQLSRMIGAILLIALTGLFIHYTH